MRTSTKLLSITAITLAATLVGCGGKDAVMDCTWPDTPTEGAPGWVCDEPVEGVAVSAVGSFQKSAAGHNFMKQQAAARARVELAQNMRTHVTNMIKQYAETTGAAETETVDMVNTSVSKLVTDEKLVGTRIFKTRTSPSGSIYVLVGFDEANAQKITQDILKTSMNNDNAMWQQFKAKQGQDELAAAIAAGK